MKKNISINIGGIIFHIEEDSYQRLNDYLTSINRYFSTFEDSKEIIDDIENRIAEIFLSKLSDGKQVIVTEDVEELIATMGTVKDFEAQIEVDVDDQPAHKEKQEEQQSDAKNEQASSTGGSDQAKRLYRNTKQRVLGGVASGIAYYFSVDPLWIRLIFLAMFFNLLLMPLSGTIFIAYIVLWIVLPGNDELEEDKSYKKLYRNPDTRVLGGVCGGIASFFGTDSTVIRLLFVLSIFLGGAGFILYIILWIITPEAKTITQKMQMQGEPVTLSNIESNVKNSLKVKEEEENVFVKILLFPFRFIALIFDGLGKLLGPLMRFLVDAIRIIFGLIVIALGVSLMIAFAAVWGVLIGIAEGWSEYVHFGELPVDLLMNDFNFVTATAVSAVFFIPALGIAILGAMIIARQKIGNSYFGWTIFGLWLTAVILSAVMVPELVRDYRVEDDVRKEEVIGIADSTSIPTLKLNRQNLYKDYDAVDLRLRGHSDSTYKAVYRMEARGRDRENAIENASAIQYEIKMESGNIVFDEEISLDGQPFKFQTVDVIFYVPFGQPFRMDDDLSEILVNTLHLNGYRSYQMEGNEWMFDESGIVCLTCGENRSSDRYVPQQNKGSQNWTTIDGESLSFDNENFNSILVGSLVQVEIIQAEEYKVALKGKYADRVKLYQTGRELKVRYKEDWKILDDEREDMVHLYIETPNLENLELTGGCKGRIVGFDDRDMEISLDGASELLAIINPKRLDAYLGGASILNLEGAAESLDIKLDGASSLDAFSFNVDYAEVTTNGASKAKINVEESLEAKASGVSQIRYRGNGRVNSNSDGLSTIKRD